MKYVCHPVFCLLFPIAVFAFSPSVRADAGLALDTTPHATTEESQTAPAATGAVQAPGATGPELPPTNFNGDAASHAADIGGIARIVSPANKEKVGKAAIKIAGFTQRAQTATENPPLPDPTQGRPAPGPGGSGAGPARERASVPTLPPDESVEAIQTYNELEAVVLTDPDMSARPEERRRAHNLISNGRLRIGDNAGAIRSADNVLRAKPDDRDALNNRAMGQYGMGQFKEAVDDASRVVGLEEDNQRAYTTRALAYYELKNYPQALEDAKRALALDQNNKVAYQIAKLSELRVTTPEQLGLDSLQKAAADKVDRDYEAATEQRNQFEAASGAAPVSLRAPGTATPVERAVGSLNQQARNKIKNNDPKGAIQLLNMALERNPGDASSLGARAVAQSMLGEYERAVQDATAALEQSPDDTAVLDARASALLQLGRLAEAKVDVDRSIALNPRSPYAYKTRARIREKNGELGGMIADLRSAARLSPQFEPELQKVARQYNLPLEAEAAKASQTAPPAAKKPAPPGGNRRMLVVLASSVSGGLLIAFGLMHIVIGQQGRRGARLKALLPSAGAETVQALGAGPALRASYKVNRAIGSGGMGVVYEAVDKALGRKVAIKQMRPEIRDNPRERERFLQEARIVAALHHPNIVDIHSIVEDEGDLCMVFEFIEGRTVEDILIKKGRLTVREAQYIVRGVCNALDFAHKKGVIHRDLKPSNVMITNEGRVKVMDFGIARQAKDALLGSTSTQTVAGTPLYMAPEQEQGIVRTESDLYALGACLYEMVTGARPFKGPTTTASKLAKSYEKPSRVTAGLPQGLDALIDAALEPDPDRRIRTAADFAARLESLQVPSGA